MAFWQTGGLIARRPLDPRRSDGCRTTGAACSPQRAPHDGKGLFSNHCAQDNERLGKAPSVAVCGPDVFDPPTLIMELALLSEPESSFYAFAFPFRYAFGSYLGIFHEG
jgi:hypothetical protein